VSTRSLRRDENVVGLTYRAMPDSPPCAIVGRYRVSSSAKACPQPPHNVTPEPLPYSLHPRRVGEWRADWLD
jgi:hypothetical protein